MKKNILKYIILPCVSMALVFLLFPFRVLAESQTYVLCDGGTSVTLAAIYGASIGFNNSSSVGGRIVLFNMGSGITKHGYLVFEDPNASLLTNNIKDFNNNNLSPSSLGKNNHMYYVYHITINSGASISSGIPSLPYSSSDSLAVDYSYGNLAVDPEPPAPSYGNVADVSFATNIAGNGDASGQNLDKIQWNNLQDSNGIDLPEGSTVTIRAVPGQYTGTSKENLLTKLYTDFVLDTVHATDLATVSASAGWYETTWQSVANHFTWPFATILSCLQGGSYWYKNGWIYQIRLNIGDYHSEWQTIYNITSSGVENSEAIINSTSITAISQSVNNINNINQTSNNYYVSNSTDTTNNYYYYDSPINPEYSGNDVSGLFPSISEILNAIRNLPHTIGELLHNLFDDLFEIDWEYDDFEQQKQYVIENSGAFGQCIGHLDDLKTLIMSYNTASGVALIQWGDIVIDETVIIPAGVFNLGSIVSEDPMRSFYTLYQSLFSGFLYTLTFIKLYREALKALRQ